MFELDASGAAPTATWIGCVLMPDGMAANSVAAFSDRSLLATVLIMPGKTFEDAFAQRNTGAVFAWKPGEKTFQMLPGTELSANNGIETSPDDQEFYVVSTTTKRIYAYARAKPGVVLRTAQLKEVGPDNVRWTADGKLITAGHDRQRAVVRRRRRRPRPASAVRAATWRSRSIRRRWR